jgi:Zn-dependent protease
VGTILIPFISAVTPAALPLMAWGRPVQTNPLAYTRRLKVNTGRMLVSIAGPTMNLLMALLASLIIVIAAHTGMSVRFQAAIFNYLVQLNLVLMCFNLLPIPPLDGARCWLGCCHAPGRGPSISCSATVPSSCCSWC